MEEREMLTKDELAEIAERCGKATEGPWDFEKVEYESYAITSPGYLYGEMCVIPTKKDAAFIAHAREDVPKLLAEIERLNKRLDQAKEILEMDTKIIRLLSHGGDNE